MKRVKERGSPTGVQFRSTSGPPVGWRDQDRRVRSAYDPHEDRDGGASRKLGVDGDGLKVGWQGLGMDCRRSGDGEKMERAMGAIGM